jgi:hypothetical protein
VTLPFYGEPEMLAGLLLLVVWVRELSWWTEHDPKFFAQADDACRARAR